MFKEYRKTAVQPMRPYEPGESMIGVSVSPEDTPELGGMIAINPKNPSDQWYVAKKFFEDNYMPAPEIRLDHLTFGGALEKAKAGGHIARAGWNGKNMFVFYQKGYPQGIPANKNTAEALGVEEGYMVHVLPYLQMRTATGEYQMWLASQSDILAEDWMLV